MKRLTLLVVCFLLIVASASAQTGVKLGVGANFGLNFPLIQDDQASGTEFGFKGRWGLGTFIVLEPNLTFAKWGKPDAIDGVELGIDGSKLNGIGLDVVLGNAPGAIGFKPYFVAGVGSYKVKNDETGYDDSNLGFNFGLGFGVGLSPKFDLDLRGKAVIAPQDSGSKKALAIVGGVNFNFGSGIGAL